MVEGYLTTTFSPWMVSTKVRGIYSWTITKMNNMAMTTTNRLEVHNLEGFLDPPDRLLVKELYLAFSHGTMYFLSIWIIFPRLARCSLRLNHGPTKTTNLLSWMGRYSCIEAISLNVL